jgi:hypothetical protein
MGTRIQRFSSMDRQQTKTSLPPGFRARRILAKAATRIAEEHDPEARENPVKGGLSQVVGLRVSQADAGGGAAWSRCPLAGDGEHRLGNIDAQDRAREADALCQGKACVTAATADIEDAFTRRRGKHVHRSQTQGLQLPIELSLKLRPGQAHG